jgi:hypothetical protein
VGEDELSEGLANRVSSSVQYETSEPLIHTSSKVKPSTPLPVVRTRLVDEPYMV